MQLSTIKVVKEDLEKPVNRFNVILIALLFVLPLSAQVDTISMPLSETVAQDTLAQQAPLPVIEYTMQRKTYEIADIVVSGADSYEDFVLIGFSGLAVGDKIEESTKLI